MHKHDSPLMAFKKDPMALKSRYTRVSQRMGPMYEYWDTGDAWRYLIEDKLHQIIWGGTAQNVKKQTIPRTDVRSVTDTVIAFLAGNNPPKIRVEPANPLHLGELDKANFSERIGTYMFLEIDRERTDSLLRETVDLAVHRGMMISKNLWLSPEERGEKRTRPEPTTLPGDPLAVDEGVDTFMGESPAIGDIAGQLRTLDGAGGGDAGISMPPYPADDYLNETIEAEGDYPLCMDLIDPRETAWVLDTRGRTLEFYHAFEVTWDVLVATYPEVMDDERWNKYATGGLSDVTLRVLDCWDAHCNAVTINDEYLKEPTEHGYGRCPIVIEIVNGQRIRTGEGKFQLQPSPFCKPIFDALRWASWAESMSATHLARNTFMPLVHKGIASDGSSPYTTQEEGEDGDDTVVYNATFDFSPDGGVVPAFDNEDFGYPQPPPIIQILQEFKDQRLRDISIVTFAEGILSGTLKAEPSGYSVSLQKQAAMARIEPYRMSCNRFLARSLKMLFLIGYENWDRDDCMPLMLQAVAGEGESDRELSREMLGSVGNVIVEIIPDVRIDRERESKELYEGLSLGVVSELTVIDKLGHVRDPQAEMERIAFERVAKDPQHPLFMQATSALVENYMRKNKLGQHGSGAAPQAPQQPQAPPEDPMAALGGGAPPMDPSMMMGGPPGVDPSMMGGAPPPMDPSMMDPAMMGGAPAGPAPGGPPPMSPEELQMLMQSMGQMA